MPIALHELDDGVTKVILSGRIDIAGAQEIDLPMNVVGGSRRAVVIELTWVSFMASMGLRSLVMCAKAVQSKKGRIAMYGAKDDVADIIVTMGITELIPLFATEDEAIAAVSGG